MAQPESTATPHDVVSHVGIAAEALLAQSDFLANPYFDALRNGTFRLRAFRSSQTQFFNAVTFFARPMAALVARITEPRQRLDLLRNLVEEHGDFNPSAFHHATFLKFLASIGVDPRSTDTLALWPEVRAFNAALSAACVLDEIEVGVACMGIIERAFADVSAIVGQAVVASGWVTSSALTHYKLHAQIDSRHAGEFFAVVDPLWNIPAKR